MEEVNDVELLKQKIEAEKMTRVQNCAKEVEEVLKKHNCGIKAMVIIDESAKITFDKQIYPLE